MAIRNDYLPSRAAKSDRLPARFQQEDRRVEIVNAGQSISLQVSDDQRGSGKDEIDLLTYGRLLLKRRWLILAIVAIGVALALVQTLMSPSIYRATALIQVERENMQVDVRGVSQTTTGGFDPTFNQTQVGVLNSRSLAERVVEDLDLADRDISQALMPPPWLQRLRNLLGLGGSAAHTAASPVAQRAERLRGAADFIQGGLTIEPVRNSHLVQIHFDSIVPSFAAQVTNAVADAYISSTMDRQFGASSYAKKYLEGQLAELKSRLEESERALVEFAQKEKIVPTANGSSLAAQNLSDLNTSLAKAQDQRIRAEARWDAVRNATGRTMPADMLVIPTLQGLLQQLAQLQSQYQNNLQTFKPDYPSMLALKSQMDGVQKQIDNELGNIRASVKTEYDAALTQEKMLELQLDKLRTASLDVDNRSIQYNILKRDADTNRQLYNALLERYKEVGVAEGVRSSSISIIDRAAVPTMRHSPSLPLNFGIGLLLGAIVAVLVALLLERIDDTLKTPLDIEDHLRLALLGVIPKIGKQSVEDAQKDLRSAFSESYRSVRTALQFSTPRGTPKVLLITSPASGEGKSTAAFSLAQGFAQLGKRVLLVEGDLRRPCLGKRMKLPADIGLSNLLAGACTLAQAVKKTSNSRLDLILSGPLPPNPTELLAGPKMMSLLMVASEKYDQLIIDGPPVLGIADAPLLGTMSSGILFVTKAGETRISLAQDAIKRLRAVHVRLIGALINQHDPKRAGYGYSYAYNYNYYYGYGDKPRLGKS